MEKKTFTRENADVLANDLIALAVQISETAALEKSYFGDLSSATTLLLAAETIRSKLSL
jgi:hypothetical protein